MTADELMEALVAIDEPTLDVRVAIEWPFETLRATLSSVAVALDDDGALAIEVKGKVGASCTCFMWTDGLGDPTGKVSRDSGCPVHGRGSSS